MILTKIIRNHPAVRKAILGLATASLLLALGQSQPTVVAAKTQAPLACAPDGTQTSGAKYRICMPDVFWNKNLVIYAHGYVSPTEPVGIPDGQLQLPDGTSIPGTVTQLGYAFATTSYSANGLAVKEGLADLVDLVSVFRQAHPDLQKVYLVGASEGGLITALAVERDPTVFNGGLATCGPIGGFREQANYIADFRVAFDYFFPGLLPGTAISVPQSIMVNYEAVFSNTILPQLTNPTNAISVTQLFSVTGVPRDTVNPTATYTEAIHGLLWYSVYGTNDGIARLGGQPFDNFTRVYSGSLNDVALNAGVARFTADAVALNEMQNNFTPKGAPGVPLVTLHTIGDEIVPYRHEDLFRAKIVKNGMTPRHDNLPIQRYGHCNFQAADVQQGLLLLLNRVATPPPFYIAMPVVLKPLESPTQ